ncbi:MAG: polyphosphate kinase 1 [Candidatus Cloacimonetes bacterium]|nr:polyphosphate kinase 1 [Candidatus Cloacimonadota bacterium]
MITYCDDNPRYLPKELSWLLFNQRVLQEASDPSVPLIERIRFLGIYSSNLDEFFRVRVATLRRLCQLGDRARSYIGHDPHRVLEAVTRTVAQLHADYNSTYDDVIQELHRNRIHLLNETQLSPEQEAWVRSFFRANVQTELSPVLFKPGEPLPSLQERSIYLAVRMSDSRKKRKQRYAMIELPPDLQRFVVIPGQDDEDTLIFVDDIVRLMLPEIFALFKQDVYEAWTVKLTRDAELDLEDDISLSYSAKMAEGLKRRKEGLPVRFVYDGSLPRDFLKQLMRKMGVTQEDTLLPGGRYHNRSDLIRFPQVGSRSLRYPAEAPVTHSGLPLDGSLLSAIRKRDRLLHFPYNPFQQFVMLLREAALDPKVQRIRITLYRLAQNSDVIRALITARRNGKRVLVVVELQARFDENANLNWAQQLQDEDIDVVFGVAGLKVHSKLVHIEREERGKTAGYVCIATGNFNEDTAGAFEDMMLLSARPELVHEVSQLFEFFTKPYLQLKFHHLLASPWNTREALGLLIAKEISEARAGRRAEIHLKLNNLGDYALIDQLYEAAEAGVRVRLNVRGMFCARAGKDTVGRQIQAMAVVDRYLEHSRIYSFHNGGSPRYYIGSGDFLPRNFERRVETAVPIMDPGIQAYLQELLEIYWKDSRKARLLDTEQPNSYRDGDHQSGLRAQEEIRNLVMRTHPA